MRILQRLHANFSGYSTSLKANKYGEQMVTATIHVERIKKGQRFEVIRGERIGNTTAPNRSTAIKTRLWIDKAVETSVTKGNILHKTWP